MSTRKHGRARRAAPKLEELAQLKLKRILRAARETPGLRKLGPRKPAWEADCDFVSAARMTELNARFRGKQRPTDILSFPPPPVFREAGYLGQLVICGQVLKRQARELGHPPEDELDVLLVHGVLHLLGFDHELGPRHARAMAAWEKKLLGRKAGLTAGLIERSG